MAKRKKILFALLVLPLFIFMTTGEEEHSSLFLEFLGKTVNFIILFGGLTYILFKPIRDFLEKRSHVIKLSLQDAENSRKDAEHKLEEAKIRLAGLKEEIEKIKKESKLEGEREKEKILSLTQREAEKIKYFARQEIEMLINAGIQDLKEYTAELSIALAEERIKKKMSPKDQSLLIDKSCERLDNLYEKSYSGKEIHSRTS